MQKAKFGGLIIFVLMFTNACVENVDIKDARNTKIVVNGLLNTSNLQKLSITKSNALGEHFYDEVENAVVILWDEEKEAGRYSKVGYGKWQLDYQPLVDHTYKLEIQLQNGKILTAVTTMPKSLNITKVTGRNTDYRKHFIQGPTDFPYYIFIINQTGTEIVVDPVVEPNNRLETQIGTNHPYVDHFNIEQESMQSIWGNEFSTMAYMAYLRIYNDKISDTQDVPFCIEGSLGKSLVFFRSASVEYDQYMKSSIQKMLVYQVFDDDTQWFDENDIYSNITNGIGIFAAYNDQKIVFNEIEN